MKIAFRRVPFSAEQIHALDELAGKGGYETVWLREDDKLTARELSDCQVLMGYFPPELIKALPGLKWVQTPSAGVERMCQDIYRNPDAVLTNCSGAFGTAISEYMLMGLLMLLRRMPAYLDNQRNHTWGCVGPGRTIWGSRITVVGMGDIGTQFAARAKALGAVIRGVRRRDGGLVSNFDQVYTADRLVEAVQGVDAVVLCLPGTGATAGLISKEVLDAMAPGTILVNCGRGSTVDQEALMDALREKRLAGAVLDVFESEPLGADSPLWDMENVVITPHISGRDGDSINTEAIFAIFLENLNRWIHNQPLTHLVDRTRGY